MNNSLRNIFYIYEKKKSMKKPSFLNCFLLQYRHKQQQNTLILPKSKQVKENITKPYQTTKRP